MRGNLSPGRDMVIECKADTTLGVRYSTWSVVPIELYEGAWETVKTALREGFQWGLGRKDAQLAGPIRYVISEVDPADRYHGGLVEVERGEL